MLDQNVAMLISVVIPAFNEEGYLGETLASLNRAKAFLQGERGLQVEIIVVDNDSDDSTADVARALGATVARETQHNVAKVRNLFMIAAPGQLNVRPIRRGCHNDNKNPSAIW